MPIVGKIYLASTLENKMKTRYEELLEQYGIPRECFICNSPRGIDCDGRDGDDYIFTLTCDSGNQEVGSCRTTQQFRLVGAAKDVPKSAH